MRKGAFSVVILSGLLLLGCGKDKSAVKDTPPTSEKKVEESKSAMFIGVWEEIPPGNEMGGAAMEFAKDGTLYSISPNGKQRTTYGKWKLLNDSTLQIDVAKEVQVKADVPGIEVMPFTITSTELTFSEKGKTPIKLRRKS